MRIDPSRRLPSYHGRRFQLRLLSLVAALALVLVGVEVVRNPRMWDFVADGERAKKAEARKPVDFDVDFSEDEPLRPGEFRSRSAPPRPQPNGSARAEADSDAQQSDGSSTGDAARTGSERASQSAGPGPGESPPTEIEREWLQPIRDSTIGVRRDEADSFYAILARARDVPQSRLESDSLGFLGFRVLMNDSESLRGRLVTIEGELKRLLPLTPDVNRFGITQLYEGWLITEADPAYPIRIVFTEHPEGVPEGMRITQRTLVKTTGYFFKREGYASEGGMHIAPLVLAKRLKPMRSVVVPQGPPIPAYLSVSIVAVALTAAAGFGAMIWWFSRGDKRFSRRHLKRMINERANDGGASLDRLVAVDPLETLRDLEQADRQAESEDDEA